MSVVTFKHRGDFKRTERFLNALKGARYLNALEKYGQMGVEALAAATPKDTGLTAASWVFDIERTEGCTKIIWSNTNVNKYVNVALLIQHGHGTGTGGYVEGIDYINPALKPIFDAIGDEIQKEVASL